MVSLAVNERLQTAMITIRCSGCKLAYQTELNYHYTVHAESIKSIDNNVVEVLSKSVRATKKFEGGAYPRSLKQNECKHSNFNKLINCQSTDVLLYTNK